MRRAIFALASGLAFSAVFVSACGARNAQTAPAQGALAQIPDGCHADLSGEYRHAVDAAFRYQARDDGTTLLLHVQRPQAAQAPDAAAAAADGGTGAAAAATTVTLTRTPKGFVGAATGVGLLRAAQRCEVQFPTEVVRCDRDVLVVRSACCATVSETCQAAPAGEAPRLLEHRLVRVSDPAN